MQNWVLLILILNARKRAKHTTTSNVGKLRITIAQSSD